MASYPPVIPTTTTTPPSEWADSSISTLANTSQQRTSDSRGEFSSPGSTTADSKKAAQGVLESARQYLPAQKDVEQALNTAKQDLPESGASYLPGGNSEQDSPLPSKENPGLSRGGVGSLPGNLSEASVAKLPDERIMEGSIPAPPPKTAVPKRVAHLSGSHDSMPSTEVPSGSYGGVGSLPGNFSEVSVAKLPEERRQDVFPSHETDHEVLGKTGGVGALPGGPDESRVALLPEERVHPESSLSLCEDRYLLTPVLQIGEIYEHHEGGIRSHIPAALGGVGAGAAAKEATSTQNTSADQARLSFISFAAQHQGKSEKMKEKVEGGVQDVKQKVTSSRSESSGGGSSAAGYGGGYHPAELHPSAAGYEAYKSPDARSIEEKTSSEIEITGSPATTTGSGEHNKAGFVGKIKGEVKVISGKLGHDEKKIEEGRHMMGK
ncbi:hypothetical protein DXG03_000320 [Asterophora parasitica]|uniref:Uncharacterized protein n=1 Tax=Asterophora parasitica TaxID=117018 RepID=A0A9P7KEB7_9AGAR|nr:hypothetical protein DXG03_000320 [Asterophora parasitica]